VTAQPSLRLPQHPINGSQLQINAVEKLSPTEYLRA